MKWAGRDSESTNFRAGVHKWENWVWERSVSATKNKTSWNRREWSSPELTLRMKLEVLYKNKWLLKRDADFIEKNIINLRGVAKRQRKKYVDLDKHLCLRWDFLVKTKRDKKRLRIIHRFFGCKKKTENGKRRKERNKEERQIKTKP